MDSKKLSKNEGVYELSGDISVITAEISAYRKVAGQAIFEIGRRLKHVRENDLAHGEWTKWCESIDVTQDLARRYIRVFEEFGEDHVTSRDMGLHAMYEIAQIPKEHRTKAHTVPSTGEKKKPEDMTVRELREVKSSLKNVQTELEEENEKRLKLEKESKEMKKQQKLLESKLEEEKNKPKEVETKIVEKEVDRTDYSAIEQLREENERNRRLLERLERDNALLEKRLAQEERDANEHRKLKEEIKLLSSQRGDVHRRISAVTSLSGLCAKAEDVLENTLAPIRYSKAVAELSDDEVVMDSLSSVIDQYQGWVDDMRGIVPNSKNNNIVEVIEHE